MKKSARALKMERHHKRMSKTSKLGLVSLMDIFTILVFFLIINSSTVEILETDKSIKLPKSVSKTFAKEDLLLLVNDTDLILQGKKVARIDDIVSDNSETITSLTTELEYHKSRQQTTKNSKTTDGAITIMGDKSIEYSILKKILLTCSSAGFGDISLAVEKALERSEGNSNVRSN